MTADHANREHALLSPSSSQKWLNCPGSARLEDSMPESTSSYADEGRLAHELCEVYLRIKLYGASPELNAKKEQIEKDERCDREMKRSANDYVDYITETAYSKPVMPYIAMEQKVDISMYAPDCFGHVDCVIISGTEMYVIDFKYGRGVEVQAESNTQLMLYALGALERYRVAFVVETVHLVVIQPRKGGTSVWMIKADSLKEWGKCFVKPAAAKAYAEGGEFVPGDWCEDGFCRAAGSCATRAKHLLGVVQANQQKDIESLSPEEIGSILTAARDFTSWLKKFEEFALSAALAGIALPGWKAVEGTSRRIISDETKAVRLLKSAGFKQATLYKRSLLGLGELEKLVGKKELVEILGDTLEKPQGKPTLVPESDKRQPYQQQALDAADIFKGEE